jgi:hypothetical protein
MNSWPPSAGRTSEATTKVFDFIRETSISLNIIGNEAWLPEQVYVFGLDTANGRPNEVVTLSAISVWGQGELNNSGSVSLPISV